MFTKRSAIVALIGLNLFLLAVLLIGSYSLPSAVAQARGRAGDFVCVTVQATGQSYQVLYVLDAPRRQLHAFVPTVQRKLAYAGFTDLKRDFRGADQP